MKDRRKTLGGSDANRIMRGDWHSLWLEKTGRKEPEDLSWVLPVQIGIATEELHARFFDHESSKKTISNDGGELKSTHQFMSASYDGVEQTELVPIEFKHTNANNTLDGVISTYMPQLQHYTMVSGCKYIYLSVIFGNNRHEWCKVDADKDYMNKLYGIENSFWQHVQKDKEPEELDTSELPKLAGKIKINDMRSIDFDETGNNEFLSNASKWIETKIVADENKALGVILKGSVPDDCRKATGGGVIITRNKAGNLILKQNQRRM